METWLLLALVVVTFVVWPVRRRRAYRRMHDYWGVVPEARAASVLGCFGGVASVEDVAAEMMVTEARAGELLELAVARGWAVRTDDGRYCACEQNRALAQYEATGTWL